jgi:hypothetical protein
MLRLFVFAFLIAAFGAPVRSEEPRDVAFHYSIDPPSASILHSRAIHIYVRGNKPDLTLTNITLRPNQILGSTRPDIGETLPFSNASEGSNNPSEVHLGDGKHDVELIFKYKSGSFWMPLRHSELMILEPGAQKLTFTAQVREPMNSNVFRSTTDSIEMFFAAPDLAITIGGAVGALTLAFLRLVYRFRAAPERLSLSVELREGLFAILGGGLIAWTLTFLGGILSGTNLGIEIAATSWKGGVIIGLFSYKLGEVLAQKLWGSDNK